MNTTEDRPRLTNEQINAILGGNSTTEVPTILEGTDEVESDTMMLTKKLSENSLIGLTNKKMLTPTESNTLIEYNLTESNFKGEVKVAEVESELVIEVPEGNTYIGEFMTDLPDNVMFNKVTTGSGMTTLALTNDVKYVIAVPYVNLLLNKEVWCTNNSIDALFVHAKGHREEDIYSYTGNKIMVTYDSLHKVTNILKENRDISEWKLFIDESHTLLQSAGYRYKAVTSVLNNFKEYGSYVFGTATPVMDKYKLKETQSIKKCRLQWSNLQVVHISRKVCSNNLNRAVVSILNDHHTNKTEGNAHVFVNSVNLIAQIYKGLKRLDVKTTDIRVVCSNNDYNTKTLAKEGLAIGTVDSTLRGINFYTSTAFEGCDISDANGVSYVVVDAEREHTAIDIYTTLPQIIGRIRDTRYKNQCTLLIDPSNKFFEPLEKFKEEIELHIEAGVSLSKNYNESNNRVLRKDLMKVAKYSNYVIYDADTDTLKSNENAHLSDMNSYEARSNKLYINTNNPKDLTDKEVNNSITTQYTHSEVVIDRNLYLRADAREGKKFSTKELLKACCKDYLEASNEVEAQKILREYTEDDAFIGEAMRLGVDRIKALFYVKSKIQAELNFTDPKTKDSRKLKLLNTLKLKVGQWYSGKVIKTKMKKIYDQQGISNKPNIKHLESIYEMKPSVKRVKGAHTRGVIVTAIKLKVNN